MYPKVRVREDADKDEEVDDNKVESFSIHVSSSPGLLYLVKEGHQDKSRPSIARLPTSSVKNIVTQTKSSHEETQKDDKQIHDEDRPNIRVSSVLRPRAVLSSPDNDVVVGNKNRIKAELPKAVRDHDQLHNRHSRAQCRVSTSHVICNTHHHTHTKSSHEATDSKRSDLKGKKAPEVSRSHETCKSHHIHMKSSHRNADNKSGDLEGKNGPEMTAQSQRRSVRTVKSRCRLK